MSGVGDALILPLLAAAALGYLALAIVVTRFAPQSLVGYFLLLLGVMVTGNLLSHNTTDLTVFGIGRVLAYFAGGFLPVVFYAIYRQFTGARPNRLLYLALSVVPVATTLLAMTNAMHFLIWEPRYTEAGLTILQRTDKDWFVRVHAPFAYGLFGYTVIALASRLPSIAAAHRNMVILFVACALIPYSASIANTFLGIGHPDTPVLTIGLALIFPVIAYAALKLRAHEFSPVAYETLFDHVRDPIIVLDNDERIICANRRATELLGDSENALLGRRLWQEFLEVRRILRRAIETDLTQTLMLDDANAYEVSVAPLTDASGSERGTVVVCRDVSERRQALARLANSEHLVRTLIDTSSNGILRFGRDVEEPGRPFRCTFANRAAEAHLGVDDDSLVGTALADLESIQPQALLDRFADPQAKPAVMSFETKTGHEDLERWLRIVAEPVGDDFSVTMIDITERKQDESRMLDDAIRDPLTGVLNRRGFEQQAMAHIRDAQQAAVLYLDLNQFKRINDDHGHPAGDALLRAFANRLEQCLRPDDILGRLGGDEFAVVLPGIALDDATRVADRFVEAASEAYIVDGVEMRCTASVGVALLPHHGQDLWHLVSVADQAMFNAKAASASQDDVDPSALVEVAIAS